MAFIVKKDINVSKEIAVAATIEVFSFQVPASAKMIVKSFANYINDFSAWSFIVWILKRNGVPIYPYHEITDQIAFGAPLRELTGCEIQGADKFSIDIKNNHIDPVKCGVALKYEIWQED